MNKAILFLCIFSIAISSSFASSDKTIPVSADTITSLVKQNPMTRSSEPSVTVTAEIAEDITVIKIVLYYRALGASRFHSTTMHADKNGEYQYTINKTALDYPGLEYYIVAFDFAGNSLLHGNVNLPLVANFSDGWGNQETIKNAELQSNPNSRVVRSEWQTQLVSSNNSMWKNKWLWIGVGVLAGAVIANNESDDGDEQTAKPGFSIVIDAPPPEPTP